VAEQLSQPRTSGLSVGQEFDDAKPVLTLPVRLENGLCAPRLPDPSLFRLPTPKLAVQGRYNQSLHLGVSSRSLQGIAERPLPCTYYVIEQDDALSQQ